MEEKYLNELQQATKPKSSKKKKVRIQKEQVKPIKKSVRFSQATSELFKIDFPAEYCEFIEQLVIDIESMQFVWDAVSIENFKNVMAKIEEAVCPLKNTFKSDIDAQMIFAIRHFTGILLIPFDSRDDKISEQTLISLYVSILQFFMKCYFKPVIFLKSILRNNHLQLIDPFYRHLLREKNLVDSEIDRKFFSRGFNLKHFCLVCIQQFLIKPIFFKDIEILDICLILLKLFLKIFQLGLWTSQETNVLNEKVLLIVDKIQSFDVLIKEYIEKFNGPVPIETIEFLRKRVTNCRKIIGKIMIHFIYLEFDSHIHKFIPNFRIKMCKELFYQKREKVSEIKDIDELFHNPLSKNSRLHVYLGYILGGYLTKTSYLVPLKLYPTEDPKLDLLVDFLIGYSFDINIDFYAMSLKSIEPQNLGFYQLSYLNTLNENMLKLVSQLNQFSRKIETREQESDSSKELIAEGMQLFKQIQGKFDRTTMDPQYIASLQLSSLMHCIPDRIHIILDYLCTSSDSNCISLQRKAVLAICSMIEMNQQAIAAYLMNNNIEPMRKLFKIDRLSTLVLVCKIIENSESMSILEDCSPLFDLIQEEHEKLTNSFLEEYQTNKSDLKKISHIVLRDFICFNLMLKKIHQLNSSENYKIDIFLGSSINSNLSVFLGFLVDRHIQKNDPTVFKNQIEMLSSIMNWPSFSKSQQNMMLEESIYSALKLFRQSIRRMYRSQPRTVFRKFVTESFNAKMISELIETDRGILFLKVMLQIYLEYEIFEQNSQFGEVNLTFEYGHEKINSGDILTMEQISLKNIAVLQMLLKTLSEIIKLKKFNLSVDSLVISAYLPAVFKLINGFYIGLTNDKYKFLENPIIKELTSFLNGNISFVIEYIGFIQLQNKTWISDEKIISAINQILRNKEQLHFKKTMHPDVDNMRELSVHLMEKVVRVYEYYPRKFKYIFDYLGYSGKIYDDILEDKISKKLEFNLKYRLKNNFQSKKFKKWSEIKNQDIFENRNDKLDWKKGKKDKFEFRLPLILVNVEANDRTHFDISRANVPNQKDTSKSYLLEHKICYFINLKYKEMKCSIIDDCTNNQKISSILAVEDLLHVNANSFVMYFLYRLFKINNDLTDSLSNPVLTSNVYSLVLFMDNLMQDSSIFRFRLYEIINQNSDDSTIRDAITNLWNFHKYLFCYLSFKPFYDTNWINIFTKFYPVNNLIQNFCESNFVQFKNWFNENFSVPNLKISPMSEFYFQLEHALTTTDLHMSTKSNIMLTDKQELTPMFCRSIECLTEFVNGGLIDKAQFFFQNRMDIFTGIVFRALDDVNSKLYELKENVIIFLQALVECKDEKAIELISRNFSATNIFNLIKTLIKKLYIRLTLIKNKKYANELNWSEENPEITAKISSDIYIQSVKVLIDFYLTEEENFSEHILISISMRLYVFMKDIAKKSVRYKHFIDQFTEIERKFDTLDFKGHGFIDDKESMIVWEFMKSITQEIEIKRNITNDDEDSHKSFSQEVNEEYFNYTFKKVPSSFYITQEMRDKFFNKLDVSSIQIKHEQFFKIIPAYCEKVDFYHEISKYSLKLFYLTNRDAYRKYFAFLYSLACLLNLLLLLYYEASGNTYHAHLGNGEFAINFVASLLICCSAILLILWIFIYSPFKIIGTNKNAKKDRNPKSASFFKSLYNTVIDRILAKEEMYVCTFYIICCLLSLITSNQLYFTLQLILIFQLSDTVSGIAFCCLGNWDKLILAFLMMIILINFFSFITWKNYANYFLVIENTEGACETYVRCFWNILNIGLYKDGGIATALVHIYDEHDKDFVGRFLYDIFFFLIINILLFGIFFGIVVDAFQDYKKKALMRENDKKTICFTCGLNKDYFEKKNQNFQEHVEFHEIWKYMNYIQYLKLLAVNDYNGIDIYVSELVEKHQLTWLPTKKDDDENLKK